MPIKPLKLDFYILGEVIGPFLGGTLFFLFIFLMFQVLRLADFLIVHEVAPIVVGKISLLWAMTFLPTCLPIAFLISVLVGFGRLSSDSELVAMKAGGLGILRLSVPIVVFSIFVVTLSLMLNMEWVPWSHRILKNILIKVSNTKVVSKIKEGTFTSGFFDLLIFADKVNMKTNKMQNVFIFDEREAKNPQTIVASSGEVVPVKSDTELGSSILLRLQTGSIHQNNLAESRYQKISFNEYSLFLKIDEGASNAILKPAMISYEDLVKTIHANSPASHEVREMKGELSRRFAIAFSPFIFTFLGIGFGSFRIRAVKAGAMLIAFGTLVVYWGLLTYSSMLIHRGSISPFFAMQTPNIILAILAILVYRKAMW